MWVIEPLPITPGVVGLKDYFSGFLPLSPSIQRLKKYVSTIVLLVTYQWNDLPDDTISSFPQVPPKNRKSYLD